MLNETLFALLGFSVLVNAVAVALLIRVESRVGDLTNFLKDLTKEVDPVATAQGEDWRSNVL